MACTTAFRLVAVSQFKPKLQAKTTNTTIVNYRKSCSFSSGKSSRKQKIPNSTRQCKGKNWTWKSLDCNGGASFRLGDSVPSPPLLPRAPSVLSHFSGYINAQGYYPWVKICSTENLLAYTWRLPSSILNIRQSNPWGHPAIALLS